MDVQIRRATEKDYRTTEHLTRESFWNVYKPGCDEHFVLHNIRKSPCYVGELDLVAECDNEIIGHIVSTKATVIDALGNEHAVLCVGPLCVLPQHQSKGIGSKLINCEIATAAASGYAGMILFGNPEYYHRFGFKNAKDYGITTQDDQNFEPFMALEIQPEGLAQVTGRFFYDSVYEARPEELAEFEKNFPYREKLKTDTQLE